MPIETVYVLTIFGIMIKYLWGKGIKFRRILNE